MTERRPFISRVLLAATLCAALFCGTPVVAGAPLVSLEETYEPFADRFNADDGVVRFAAILSPTCDHCRYGARAIQSQIVEHYADVSDLAVYIVWAPMLEDDDLAAARDAAGMFDDPRVTQFWDPERYMGYLYRFDVFPGAWTKMAASLPLSHPFHDSVGERAAANAERPEWDIYMYFRKGQRWERDAVEPARFIRQYAHWRDDNGVTLSLMWIDDYAKRPVTGSLPDMLSSIMHELIPHH